MAGILYIACYTYLFNPVNAEPVNGILAVGAGGLVHGNELRLSSINLPGNAIDVAAYQNLAYVLTDQSILYVVNLDNPVNPVIVSSLSLTGTAQSLHVSANRAYIGTAQNGVEVLDLSSPASPVLLIDNVGSSSATDINVAGIYAYVANDNKQQKPLSLNEFTSLAFHASLDDRVKARTGTDIEVYGGLQNLLLAEVDQGVLKAPAINYSIENNFGAYSGSLSFTGGSTDGPLIIGSKTSFKPLLNFVDKPAIMGIWFSTSALSDITPLTLLSAGRHGPNALTNGGWSVFMYKNQLHLTIARTNQTACQMVSSPGSTKNINPADAKPHLLVAVYDPLLNEIYIYVDAVKSKVVKISTCRADTEGDDNDTLAGSGMEWFSIGEAAQAANSRSYFSGTMRGVLIFSPLQIPLSLDAIVREWYTLGSPGSRAKGIL